MNRLLLITLISIGICFSAEAQKKDSIRQFQLNEVIIKGYRTMNGIGHFNDASNSIIYNGKKTEVLEIDSIQANKAINNIRQIIGRIPGLNIVESETGGFVANGIGVRGLNPNQSTEMNVRQNGYSISADVLGYNEAYFVPPMEAVKRIEVVKGASSLQFGPHIGGMINYVLNDGPSTKPFELVTSETVGSQGLINTFNSIGGTIGKVSYYGFGQFRKYDGWRDNSNQNQFTGFAKIQYRPSAKLLLGIEYSALRNKIKMPGGLTDQQFKQDPTQSNRSRNWVNSPWNLISFKLDYTPNSSSSLSFISTQNLSARNLVWFDEPANELDERDPITNQFANREVEKKYMRSTSNELRYSNRYQLGSIYGQLAAGVKASYSNFEQFEDGVGTNGSGFNFSVSNNYFEEELEFTTTNLSPFIENVFYLGDRLTVTPGIRMEYIKSTVSGEKEDEQSQTEITIQDTRERTFLLSGIGIQVETSKYTNIYANISQSYKPITYSQIIPLGVVSNVDPNMKDSKGYSSDVGFRGTIRDLLNFDVSAFYLAYNNRIGLELVSDGNGGFYNYRTNVGNSIHKGIESYVELNILGFAQKTKSNLSIFSSLSMIDAKYDGGEYDGKSVEYAPKIISRTGLVASFGGFNTTVQNSYQAESFGDASNVKTSLDGVTGLIPSYSVWDWSSSFSIKNYIIKAGVNNLFDKKYFTYRTDEYPGPGIIPAVGRSFYIGLTARF